MKIASGSLMAVCIERVGYLRTGRVLQVILCWAMAIRDYEGEWPSGEYRGMQERRLELVEAYWLSSRPTMFRDLKRFREAFPDEVDPTRIALVVLDQVAVDLERVEQRRAARQAVDVVGSVVVPWPV